jgi:hypothetical protein
MIKLKNLILESDNNSIKTTILKPRTTYYHECPHCQKEIFEKHTYVEFINEDKSKFIEYHSDCKKPIQFYKTQEEMNEIEKFLKHLSNK